MVLTTADKMAAYSAVQKALQTAALSASYWVCYLADHLAYNSVDQMAV